MAQYIVHSDTIKKNLSLLKNAFLRKNINFDIFYSVKTNPWEPILNIIHSSWCYFEVVSRDEWNAIRGFSPSSIVINWPWKNIDFIDDVIRSVDQVYINIDNDSDLDLVKKHRLYLHPNVYIWVRIYLDNWNIWNRFGFNIESLDLKMSWIESYIRGFHFHFNTNNFHIANYEKILFRLNEYKQKKNLSLTYIDIWGWLPAQNEFMYHDDIYERLPVLIKTFFSNLYIISEVWRYVVWNGVSLQATIISKTLENGRYRVNIDTNIMHFPCFFEKKYYLEYFSKQCTQRRDVVHVEVFGNSCMQIDKMGDLVLDHIPEIWDSVMIHNIWAYSFSQASNFISLIPNFQIYESGSISDGFKSHW